MKHPFQSASWGRLAACRPVLCILLATALLLPCIGRAAGRLDQEPRTDTLQTTDLIRIERSPDTTGRADYGITVSNVAVQISGPRPRWVWIGDSTTTYYGLPGPSSVAQQAPFTPGFTNRFDVVNTARGTETYAVFLSTTWTNYVQRIIQSDPVATEKWAYDGLGINELYLYHADFDTITNRMLTTWALLRTNGYTRIIKPTIPGSAGLIAGDQTTLGLVNTFIRQCWTNGIVDYAPDYALAAPEMDGSTAGALIHPTVAGATIEASVLSAALLAGYTADTGKLTPARTWHGTTYLGGQSGPAAESLSGPIVGTSGEGFEIRRGGRIIGRISGTTTNDDITITTTNGLAMRLVAGGGVVAPVFTIGSGTNVWFVWSTAGADAYKTSYHGPGSRDIWRDSSAVAKAWSGYDVGTSQQFPAETGTYTIRSDGPGGVSIGSGGVSAINVPSGSSNLTIRGLPELVYTNTAPSSPSTPVAWRTVTIGGTSFKVPLYQ